MREQLAVEDMREAIYSAQEEAFNEMPHDDLVALTLDLRLHGGPDLEQAEADDREYLAALSQDDLVAEALDRYQTEMDSWGDDEVVERWETLCAVDEAEAEEVAEGRAT